MPPVRTKGLGKPKNAKKTIGRIVSYMGKFKALWLLVLVCVLVSSGASVIGSYLIKPAINNYILPMFKTLSSGGSLSDIGPLMLSFGKLLIGVLILFLIGVFASWSNQRLMLYISTKTLFTIRTDLFNRLEKLPIKFYDSHTHGELMSRFTNDTDTLREMMSQTIPQYLNYYLLQLPFLEFLL